MVASRRWRRCLCQGWRSPISSALLFLHHNHQESYMTFEAFVFLVCFAISLVNLLWILPLLLFA